MYLCSIIIVLYGKYNIKSKVPLINSAIARLHTTVLFNILYYKYDKPCFYRSIIQPVAMILYNILFYMYDKTHLDRAIV